MKSQAVLGIVLAGAVTVTTGADDSTAPWGGGLPIVEATKTKVGPGKYLWGSTLLLAVPDKFQGYWPDYGYRWSNAAYIDLCGGLGKSNEEERSNLGRVRLVAEAGEEAEKLIGVELRLEGEKSDEVSGGKSQAPGAQTEFTVQQLCALLSDDVGRQRVEAMVRLMAGTGIELLKTGKWHGKAFDIEQDLDLSKNEYMLLWMGSGVYDGLDVVDKVSWVEGGKPVIVWDHPSEVKLRTGYIKGGPIVVAFHEQPGYMLTQMGGVMDVAARDDPVSFQVTKGVVGRDFLASAKLQATNLDEAMFGVWANVATYEKFMKTKDLKVWLVTENAIPEKSLVPEIRVGEGE